MKVLSPIKERFKMVIFVSKIFTFMIKMLQNKNRALKEQVKCLEEELEVRNSFDEKMRKHL